MSHSNFKLINNDEPINSNLVIIVNKNGDVKTDTLALQNLLSKLGHFAAFPFFICICD